RPVIPNMMAEFGAMNAYFPPDQAVFDYLAARGVGDYTPIYPDADTVYEERHTFDVSALQPKIALPHQPDQVVALAEAVGQPISRRSLGRVRAGATATLPPPRRWSRDAGRGFGSSSFRRVSRCFCRRWKPAC
ncbi:MAG: hypothetical protein IT319_20860, partial [Anaerolineae bacterium]|nr:hypothetical protein [Anaerolineae bacterium]